MKKSIYTFLAILTSMNILLAQTDTTSVTKPAFTFSGSVDAYYRLSLVEDFQAAPGTSFANLPGFSLGMANLVVEHGGDKFGFKADLVFGPRGEDATFLSSELRPGGSSNIVNQLYAYWNVSDAVKLTLGNFNTFLGYEVISPTGNFNYSTSYMFSYGPFSHTGFKADFTLDGGFSIMAGIFNPTDATEYNPTNDYAGGIQLGYEGGGLGIWLNGLFSDGFTQLDITAGYDLTETIYVGLNATAASDNFNGIATYIQVATSDALKIGLRAESFMDKGLGLFETDESVFDVTLSANYTLGNLTLIPEIRLDAFSKDIMGGNGAVTNSISSFVFAAVYGF